MRFDPTNGVERQPPVVGDLAVIVAYFAEYASTAPVRNSPRDNRIESLLLWL